jgi:inner membrane protein involved in colicin E2 resistance
VTEPAVSYIVIPLDEKLKQSVKEAKIVRYIMHINSALNEQVKLYSDYKMELKVIGDFKMKLEQ